MSVTFRLLGMAALTALAPSCCTIVSNGPDDLKIDSVPSGKSFRTDLGHEGVTPTKISLADDESVEVIFASENRRFIVKPVLDGWLFGNIIFGGFIGIATDFITGAAYKQTSDEVVFDLAEGKIDGVTPKYNTRLTPAEDPPQP